MGGGEHTVNKIRVSIAFHRAGVTRLNSGGDCLPSLSLS